MSAHVLLNLLNELRNSYMMHHMTFKWSEIAILARKTQDIVIMYETLLWTSFHNVIRICEPIVVYIFWYMALFHSQKQRHMEKYK